MTAMDTKVATPDGVVEGMRGKRTRRGTISWKGIPYAAPPVGAGRFQAPRPVHPWPGVRNCTHFGKAAIQEKRFTAVAPGKYQPMGEDSLTLNVFSPDSVPTRPRPVMVFIHGGANMLGTAATPLYDGSALARAEDVVVVTIQYRFGAFGYLDFSKYSTSERRYDANVGLLDQIAALRWVQRSIAVFGGDPDNVTVFGESAGGSAVVTLLASPAAEGLFARAIAESPAPELVVNRENADIFADEFLRLLRDPERRATAPEQGAPIPDDEAQRLLDGATAGELLRTADRLMRFGRRIGASDPLPFGPVVGEDSLPLAPLAAAMAGTTQRVPLIIGTNGEEGRLFEKFWNVLPDAQRALTRFTDSDVRDEITAAYPGGEPDLVKLSADGTFWAPVITYASAYSAVAPTYVYRFDFYTRVLGSLGLRATHATELFAVFGAYRAPIGAGLAVGDWSAAARVTDDVQSRWGDFARDGVPGSDWPRYTAATRDVLVFDRVTHVESDPAPARRRAWMRAYGLGDAERTADAVSSGATKLASD
ncbi:carboxylesterase/lipase family protein [Gordonia sinesedis]